jgi:hypothetical protein
MRAALERPSELRAVVAHQAPRLYWGCRTSPLLAKQSRDHRENLPSGRPPGLWDTMLDDGETVRATFNRLVAPSAALFSEKHCPDSLILDIVKRLPLVTHPGPFSPPGRVSLHRGLS